ncbi:MAG: hypothetical protein ACR2JR_02130 [Rubrobacteraceae bacterium]
MLAAMGAEVVVTGHGRGLSALFFRLTRPFMRAPEQGAATAVWFAAAPEAEGVTGRYFFDRKEIPRPPVSHDEAAWKRLWEVSKSLTNLRVPS